ncbi:MAG: hypothetical protein KGV44_02005 [Flavobacteriaceae bacterium]|nr:hypothetical protein [Flavobacteriaceae bacterium]
MKNGKVIKRVIIVILSIGVLILLGLGILNSYFGWYSRGLWKHRMYSSSLHDSKKRGVFVKTYKTILELDSGIKYQLKDTTFYLEKGFKCGMHSLKVTNPLTTEETDYPYQLKNRIINILENKRLGFLYLKIDNPTIQDSVYCNDCGNVYLKNIDNDTLILRVISWDAKFDYAGASQQDTIGIVKLY